MNLLNTNKIIKVLPKKLKKNFLKKSDLWFWNDFDSHIQAFQATFLGLSRASIAEMASSHFVTELIVSSKVFRKSEILVQTNITLASLGNGGLIGLDGAMSSGEQCPDVLCGWRRRERSLEDSQRSWTDTGIGIGICRWVLEETRERTWAVKWKVWGFLGPGIRWRLVWVWNYGGLGLSLVGFDGFSMTESHGIRKPRKENGEKVKNFKITGLES